MNPESKSRRVSEVVADYCYERGAGVAFTLVGSGNGELYSSLCQRGLRVFHSRTEEGAMYAALAASEAAGRMVVVSVTTGEAVLKALSAGLAVRAECAWVLLISTCSNPVQLGRAAIQETGSQTMPAGLYSEGALLDWGGVLDDPHVLPATLAALDRGFQRQNGFFAHLALTPRVHSQLAPHFTLPDIRVAAPCADAGVLDHCAEAIARGRCALLVGRGAQAHAAAVRRLVQRTRMRALTTPRGKGVIEAPCIGLGGDCREFYPDGRPDYLLVLGTRLGEASCLWDPGLLPKLQLLHVDLDASFGAAYPNFPTLGIQSEMGGFLAQLEERVAALVSARRVA